MLLKSTVGGSIPPDTFMSPSLSQLLTLLTLGLAANLPFRTTPLWVGVSSALITLNVSAIFALQRNSWYALIAITIYIGGLLVIFAYFTACHPNNKVIPWPYPLLFSFSFIILNTLSFAIPGSPHPAAIPPYDTLFNPQGLPTIILLATVLFIALIIVVKLSQRREGPLRPWQKNN